MVVDDDRSLQDGRVLDHEVNQFGDGHVIKVDGRVLEDLGPARDDVVGAVFAFGDGFLDVVGSQRAGKDVHRFIGDLIFFEPLTDFSAARATRGYQDFNHGVILHV